MTWKEGERLPSGDASVEGFLVWVMLASVIGGPVLLLFRRPVARLYLAGQEYQRRHGFPMNLSREDVDCSIRLMGYVFCVIFVVAGLVFLVVKL
jgi:hypothetical protein